MLGRHYCYSRVKPYFSDEFVTLYHGDAMEIGPRFNLRADAVITDPPYNETSLDWDRWPDGWPIMALALAPVLWCFGSFRMFWETRDEFKGWKLAQDLVWEKHNGSNSSDDRFRRVHELPVHFYRDDVKWEDVFKKPIYTADALKKTIRRKSRPPQWGEIGEPHFRSEDGGPRLQTSVIYARSCHGYAVNETQKPEGIVSPLLEYSVPLGGLVIDLFAGSGTTLAVARQQGKRAIGIEKRESQCAEIVARLSQQTLNLHTSTS